LDKDLIETLWEKIELLTPRERDIIAALQEGLFEHKQIAESLGISIETLKRRLSNIYLAMDLSSKLQLTIIAYSKKLMEEPDIRLTSKMLLTALLTPREAEIANLIAEGCSNLNIAARLSIKEITVRRHINSILSMLQCSNRIEVAVYVLREQFFFDQVQRSSSPTPQ
jgi:DNA-binding NarL/FixJ family response regulator